jgi:hypothetical protein
LPAKTTAMSIHRNGSWFIGFSALAVLVTVLSGCSADSSVGCYYSPMIADVTVTVKGLSKCEDHSVRFLDAEKTELSTVELSVDDNDSSLCSASYLPDETLTLDEITVQLIDDSDKVITEKSAERPYVESRCYTGYDEITVELEAD